MPDNLPLLTLIVFLPLLGALTLLFLRRRADLAKAVALSVLLAELLVLLLIVLQWPALEQAGSAVNGFVLLEDRAWIPPLGARYLLGMDGISLLMVGLSVLSAVMGILVIRPFADRNMAIQAALILAALAGIVGLFLALDLLLFYLFWELMLLPVFVLVGWWGSGRSVEAAMKFMVMTLAGSLALLLAIGATYLLHIKGGGSPTFALHLLAASPASAAAQPWLAAAFLLAFLLKIPVVPFHFWQPDTYRSAPVGATLLLAMVMAKTGGYAMIRFVPPLFPQAFSQAALLLYLLAAITIVYAGLVAFAQQDIKRLLAWSSIGHLGFVLLGIAAWQPVPLSGAVLHMVNHGITAGALFLLAHLLEQRAGTLDQEAFGGLWGQMPRFSFFLLFFSLASIGLPGLNNFVGEFLVLAGSFKAQPVIVAIAFIGVVLPLIYMTRLLQRVLFGPAGRCGRLADLDAGEFSLLLILAIMDLYLGMHPAPLLDLIHRPVALLTGVMP